MTTCNTVFGTGLRGYAQLPALDDAGTLALDRGAERERQPWRPARRSTNHSAPTAACACCRATSAAP